VESHPLALMFPEMAQDERRELMEHISTHGQLHPIVTHEGMILDGRNRYWCCLVLGLAPVLKEWDGEAGSPLAYVVGCNLNRRHLTPGQRAAIAVDLKERLQEEYRERQLAGLKRGKEKGVSRVATIGNTGDDANSRVEAAAMMNVSHGYVSEAERIREASPIVFEAVRRGDASIPDGRRIVADADAMTALESGAIDVTEARTRARRARPETPRATDEHDDDGDRIVVPARPREAADVLLRHFHGEALGELIAALSSGFDGEAAR